MGYPRGQLNQGEDIVLDMHPHWRVFVAPGAVLVLALAGLGAVVAVDLGTPGWVAAGVALLLGLGWLALRLLVWRTTYFVVTTDRLIRRSGVLGRSGLEIPLERVNNIAFNQTLLERMLRVADLQIESAGETGRQMIADVLNPSQVQNQIYLQMEAAQDRDARRAAGASLSVADELNKLEQLRRRGVLSQAEFESQKARLLGSR